MTNDFDKAHELLAQLKNGSEHALAELFTLYHDRLKKIVRFRLDYRLRGRISESDVIQDTFLNASKRIHHFGEKKDLPFFIWLRLLVQQQLIDLHRRHLQAGKRDVRKEISIENPGISPHTSLAIAANLVGALTSPSQALNRVEQIAFLEQALNNMSDIDREVIALRHFEELTSQETAEVLGIEERAASQRYVRAMKRLRAIVAKIPGMDSS